MIKIVISSLLSKIFLLFGLSLFLLVLCSPKVASAQCLPPQATILSGSCNDCFTAVIQVSDPNDPVNGVLTLTASSFSGDGNPAGIPFSGVPASVVGTATFTVGVGNMNNFGGVNITVKNSCCETTLVTVVNFSTSRGGIRGSVKYIGNTCNISPIQMVSFETVAGNTAIDDNPNMGAGKRVFPDKLFPTDNTNRNIVTVKAQTALPQGTMVYFKSFDVDDPSDNTMPVDCNGFDGMDNRGNIFNGGISFKGELLSASVPVDSNGVAQVRFRVTMFPGDNFRVAASEMPTFLNTVEVDKVAGSMGQGFMLRDNNGIGNMVPEQQISPMLTVWRRLHVEVDVMDTVTDNLINGNVADVKNVAADEACTNCTALKLQTKGNPLGKDDYDRFENGKIVIESIGEFKVIGSSKKTNGTDLLVSGKIDAGKTKKKNFLLVDDDDFNNNDQSNKPTSLKGDEGEKIAKLENTLNLMLDSSNLSENVFAVAYIQPEYNWAQSVNYNETKLPFLQNFDDLDTRFIDDELNKTVHRDSASDENDSFWIAYVQLGYQSNIKNDNDPSGENAFPGVSLGVVVDSVPCMTFGKDIVSGANGSSVFVETSVDFGRERNDPTAHTVDVPHEVGHQFGILGDSPGKGIMSSGYIAPAGRKFIPQHINILRSRLHSPGQ